MMRSQIIKAGKLATLVPLAALSAAWTANVAGVSPASVSTAPPAASSGVPGTDGSEVVPTPVVPATPYQPPVSVTTPPPAPPSRLAAPRVISEVATASAAGIPDTALAAYQRAATVIDTADTGCGLDWQLIAAIGRVESDHGRTGGSTLSATGVATPAIYGPVLNGKGAVARVVDTDGGRYDGDTSYDRAVGPMQFLPSTWALVGVDGDGDGRRDPQDINDAALASAVYLCAGSDNLATTAGQRAAVLRYNHSASYLATVMGVAAAYRRGDYTAVPGETTPIGTPTTTDAVATVPASGPRGGGHRHGHRNDAGAPSTTGTSRHPHHGTHATDTASSPGDAPDDEPTSSSPTQTTQPSDPSEPSQTTASSEPSDPPASSDPTPAPATTDQLTDLCKTQIGQAYPQATSDAAAQALNLCLAALNGTTLDQADNQVGSVVAGLGDQVDGLTPAASDPPSDAPSDPADPPADSNTDPTDASSPAAQP